MVQIRLSASNQLASMGCCAPTTQCLQWHKMHNQDRAIYLNSPLEEKEMLMGAFTWIGEALHQFTLLASKLLSLNRPTPRQYLMVVIPNLHQVITNLREGMKQLLPLADCYFSLCTRDHKMKRLISMTTWTGHTTFELRKSTTMYS